MRAKQLYVQMNRRGRKSRLGFDKSGRGRLEGDERHWWTRNALCRPHSFHESTVVAWRETKHQGIGYGDTHRIVRKRHLSFEILNFRELGERVFDFGKKAGGGHGKGRVQGKQWGG